MDKVYKIEFTSRNIFILLAIGIGIFIAVKLYSLFFLFLIAFIISSAIRPLVNKLQKKGVPRFLGIFLIYSLLLIFLAFMIYFLGKTIADQVEVLSSNLTNVITEFITRIGDILPNIKDTLKIPEREVLHTEVDKFLTEDLGKFLTGNLNSAVQPIFGFISNVVAFLFSFFTVVMLSAYMVHKEENFYDGIINLLPKKNRSNVKRLIHKVETQLGNWLQGQIILMFVIGIMAYIGMAVPGVLFPDTVIAQYAVSLAFIAGVLEVVPSIGPVITWVLAILVTFGSGGSVVEVGYMAFLFTAIQQLEGAFIVPVVMKRAIGIDPIITILGVIAASSLFDIVGAIMALPIIAAAQIILEDYFEKKQAESKKQESA